MRPIRLDHRKFHCSKLPFLSGRWKFQQSTYPVGWITGNPGDAPGAPGGPGRLVAECGRLIDAGRLRLPAPPAPAPRLRNADPTFPNPNPKPSKTPKTRKPFPHRLYLPPTQACPCLTVSVIIVNYNVRFFLEQCLHSLRAAARGLEVEAIVVDNNSTDGSPEYLKARFPELIYHVNTQNVGFAKACNQGLALASGEYILFLNPDTLLAEDTLHVCLDFFRRHPKAGGLGIRMIDGTGAFLRESKRSFPGPMTALYKLFGLSLLFPRSRSFGRYHLGHLSEHANWEVDVLAGAFMLIPRKVLDEVGSFDETFFMYGEDVDLSYRIQAAGYQNWYVAESSIIHFKGESTKRGSLNYVRLFYSAMNIFVRKHYGGTQARLFRASIHAAIGVRAALAAAAKFIRWIGLPIIDGILLLLSFWLVKELWTHYVRTDIVLPEALIRFSLPAYALAYIVTAYYAGLYDKIYRRGNLLRAAAFASLVLLAGYALLPEKLRFSRAILLFGALLSFVAIGTVRRILLSAGVLQRPAESADKPFVLVAAAPGEYGAVTTLLERHKRHQNIIGRVGGAPGEPGSVAGLAEVGSAVRALGAEELIFCAGSLSYKEIIAHTARLRSSVRLRYHAAGSDSVVGSDSKDSSGEALSIHEPLRLALPGPRRSKRLLDVALSAAFLLTLPLHLLAVRRPGSFAVRCAQVLLGRRTWVGYCLPPSGGLPPLRPGVLCPNGPGRALLPGLPAESLRQIDRWYARDFDAGQDLRIILKNYRWLGL
ncbi:MAG: glycosyltransferase [Chitinophagaceae bacterium]|nr:MAG: glycosyltransferase [Chitinophagaceae bacterium]